jgi:Family of unknown function (DUF6368)
MAGPTVGILAPKKLDEQTKNAILEYIYKVAEKVTGINFWVNSRPFIYSLGPDYAEEIEEYSKLNEIFGCNPLDIIGLSAMCNDTVDHQELGKLTLEIAILVNGVVAFGNSLNYYTSDPQILGSKEFVEFEGESIINVSLFSVWLKHADFRMVK